MARKFTLIELVVGTVLAGILAGLAVVLSASAREHARRTSCAQNLKAITCAMGMYVDVPANGGIFPTSNAGPDPYSEADAMKSLELLLNAYVQDSRVFTCPSKPPPVETRSRIAPTVNGRVPPPPLPSSYGYDPGHGIEDPVAAILADRKGTGANSDNHGPNAGQNVALPSGAVNWSDTSKFGGDDIFNLDKDRPRSEDAYVRQ